MTSTPSVSEGSSPSAAVPPSPPPTATPPPGRRRSTTVRIAFLAIVVVVIVVLALLFAGILLGGGGGRGSGVSFFTARSAANAAAARVEDGPWFPVGAYADEPWVTLAGGYGIETGTGLTGVDVIAQLSPTVPVLPADQDSLPSGLSPWWGFLYSNGTTNGHNEAVILVVVVVNGTAVPIEIETSHEWGGQVPASPSSGLVDSTTVMAAAVASNQTFVDAHPRLNVSLELVNATGFPPLGEVWYVTFTTCPLGPSVFDSTSIQYLGYEYTVPINAATGVVVYSEPVFSLECYFNG
jgi:hypothetical protein